MSLKIKTNFNRISREAERILSKSRGSHDLEHTKRVLKLAVHIARKEGADVETVEIAAMLHDIGRRAEDRSGGRIDHAALGVKMAGTILGKYGLPEYKKTEICRCIEAHRFRGNIRPKTLEAKCLFDADKLDSIGAVGIGRAFLFAGEVGAKLHNRGVDLSKTKPYTEEDTAYREYMVKLRRVKTRMLTKEGKRLAKQRHEFMTEFFERLNKEVEGLA
jgi:uncharacterized protein